MYTYECWDIDRAGNCYHLKVRITFNKKGERSDTVILVKHLGSDVEKVYDYDIDCIIIENEGKELRLFSKAQETSPEELGAVSRTKATGKDQ